MPWASACQAGLRIAKSHHPCGALAAVCWRGDAARLGRIPRLPIAPAPAPVVPSPGVAQPWALCGSRVAATLPVGRHSQRCPTARCSMEPQRGVARRDSMRRQQTAWVGGWVQYFQRTTHTLRRERLARNWFPRLGLYTALYTLQR